MALREIPVCLDKNASRCLSPLFISFLLRLDGVVKQLTESRDFDHRLRALENEVGSESDKWMLGGFLCSKRLWVVKVCT